MNESVNNFVKELDALSQEQYENLAKCIADFIAEHDVSTLYYMHQQHHHSGEIFIRLAGYSRKRAHTLAFNVLNHHKKEWAQMVTDEQFCDYVLSFLCGNGMEVEWGKE